MITVAIYVNGVPLIVRSASRVGKPKKGKPSEYRVDTGDIIMHYYDEGAIVLAHKLLDTAHEI
jgi:hypothetical protein